MQLVRDVIGTQRDKKEEGFPKLNFNKQVISEQTAYQITSILRGVITRGTFKKLRDLNVKIAGKTGTTNNNFDAWFIGYNSNLVVGVYVNSIIQKHWKI